MHVLHFVSGVDKPWAPAIRMGMTTSTKLHPHMGTKISNVWMTWMGYTT